jgi:hypothetical protein
MRAVTAEPPDAPLCANPSGSHARDTQAGTLKVRAHAPQQHGTRPGPAGPASGTGPQCIAVATRPSSASQPSRCLEWPRLPGSDRAADPVYRVRTEARGTTALDRPPRLPRPGGRRRAAACALVPRSALAACWACAAGEGCGLVANALRCPSFSIVTLKTDAGTAAARSRPVSGGCVLHARPRGMPPPQHGFIRRLKDATDGSTRACGGCIHP